jgi:hypothetical protein
MKNVKLLIKKWHFGGLLRFECVCCYWQSAACYLQNIIQCVCCYGQSGAVIYRTLYSVCVLLWTERCCYLQNIIQCVCVVMDRALIVIYRTLYNKLPLFIYSRNSPILWNPKVHYRVYKSTPPISVLSYISLSFTFEVPCYNFESCGFEVSLTQSYRLHYSPRFDSISNIN